jgi:hypothetical protein
VEAACGRATGAVAAVTGLLERLQRAVVGVKDAISECHGVSSGWGVS